MARFYSKPVTCVTVTRLQHLARKINKQAKKKKNKPTEGTPGLNTSQVSFPTDYGYVSFHTKSEFGHELLGFYTINGTKFSFSKEVFNYF